MSLAGWIAFSAVGFYFVMLFWWGTRDDEKSKHELPHHKWKRLKDKSIIVRETGIGGGIGWRLRAARFRRHKDFRYLIKKGHLEPTNKRGYYEPSLALTDPVAANEIRHKQIFLDRNQRRVPTLVARGKIQLLEPNRMKVLSTDGEFLDELRWSVAFGLFHLRPDGTYLIDYSAATQAPPVVVDTEPTHNEHSKPPEIRSAYQEYLLTPGWKIRREEAVRRAHYRCQVCYKSTRLEVHHRTYANMGHELPEDLTVLCWECHGTFHAGGRMPVKR